MARWTKLGIVAGDGALPLRLCEACLSDGFPFHVIRLAGMSSEALNEYPSEECGLAEAGKIIRTLKNEGCDSVVMAGVVRRPDFKTLRPDWRGAALLPKIIAAAARGDGAMLSVLVDTFESEGLAVVGAEEVIHNLAAGEGTLGKHAPHTPHLSDIKKAAAVIAALGPFDVGQAAVVASGFVLAIEAAEGTDALLTRCASLPATMRGGADPNGVLVKAPKPGQELRVDLPTIGVDTIRRAQKAGLSGVAIQAGCALIIDRDAVIAEADALGLFVYGFTANNLQTLQ